MLKILYWNIKKKSDKLLKELETLSNKHDIIILAEVSEPESKLKKNGTNLDSIINSISSKTGFQYADNNKNAWLHLWSRDKVNIELVEIYDKIRKPKDIADKECGDSEYFAYYLNKFERMQFYKVNFSNVEFLLVPIHFPSRIYASVDKQKDISVHFRKFIERIEIKYNLKSIIVGDFNMNPFEKGMIHHESFHALPTQHLDSEIEFYEDPYRTFYNPTWEKYGDYNVINGVVKQKPSGSYFLKQSNDLNYYWYLFDQVILRKELIKYFSFEDFQILTSVNSENDLLNNDFSPNDKKYSDHLPISFTLKIQ
ncbi:MAG: hypothetical protein JEZ01_04430 [Labilibaculum sp.]|nr:hypothetical protein [Labilibaculum sp.]MBI9056999.1 hypothetical protein [Labilibaculum sp.]